jgi:hypothetical protein
MAGGRRARRARSVKLAPLAETTWRRGSQTHIQAVSPPGLPLIWLVNTLGIIRKVGRGLRIAPGLGRPAACHETGMAVNK